MAPWFAGKFGELEPNPCDRVRTGIIAAALRPRFLQEPALREDCGRLNRWDPNRDETFGGYLDSWCAELLGDGLGVRTPDVVRGLLIPGTG